MFIGGDEIKDVMRDVLRDEALYISRSRLWELMSDMILNEAATLSLVQATEWEHVQNAKMLYHWGHVFRNMLYTLSK